MRQFNYDENEEHHRREVDNFFGDDLEKDEFEAVLKEEQAALDLQYKLVRQELNHRLLRTAVRLAEKSFWWRFYSLATRLSMIDKAYKKLKKLEEAENADV